MRLLASSPYEERQVVGVPDGPVGRVTGSLQVLASALVAAHLLPVRLVLAVQRGEGDVREQRRGDPALRRAGHRPLEAARFSHHARFQERAHEREHALVGDPPSHFPENEAVRELVEASFDIRFHDLRVAAGREVVDLLDRVLRPASGPVGVARCVEVRFEDRLHDELEGHLAYAVTQGRDTQPPVTTVALRYQPLADRQRPERSRLQLLSKLCEELLDATRFDVTASGGIHSGGP